MEVTIMSQPHLHTVDTDSARFEAGAETRDNSATPPVPPAGGDGDRSKRAQKARADKALPTDRLKFDNQIKVLRAVAATSGNARRGSTAEAMSAAIDLSGGTGGLNSRFFRSAGWFESVGRGEYTASPGLLAYNQHITIDPDAHHEATAAMRTEVEESWFWETLEPILANGHPISLKLAILELAKAAGATNHALQLETIVDWLGWVGLVDREGDQIKLREVVPTDEQAQAKVEIAEIITGNAGSVDEDEPSDAVGGVEEAVSAPTPAAGPDLDAIVSFNMSVRLTAADMKSLDQEQRDFVLALAERLRG